MNFEDLKKIYLEKREKEGTNVYRHVSQLFEEAKETHRTDFLKGTTAKRAVANGKKPDPEQSWRAFKGKNLEKLIQFMIEEEVNSLGLNIADGNSLERTKTENLSEELAKVKKNLLIDYGEFGCHLPDVDLVVYKSDNEKEILAVLSVKVTLRERIAQTGYWKLKFLKDPTLKHIKVYFITLDEDGTLITKNPAKKGRAIVETDTDGSYILSELTYEESDKIKMFDKLIEDLNELKKVS